MVKPRVMLFWQPVDVPRGPGKTGGLGFVVEVGDPTWVQYLPASCGCVSRSAYAIHFTSVCLVPPTNIQSLVTEYWTCIQML